MIAFGHIRAVLHGFVRLRVMAGVLGLSLLFVVANGGRNVALADPPPDAFTVSLPLDTATDSLGSGAAELETDASEDDYTFTLGTAAAVEIDTTDCPEGYALHWELDDATSSPVDTGGCGTHATSLLDAGTYMLRVTPQDAVTGTYTLRAFVVPAPDQFSVSLPLDTATDSLGGGVADLETTASEDDYTFTLASASEVEIDTGSCPDGYALGWVLDDATSWQVDSGGCGTHLTSMLDAGTYTLRVSPQDGRVGTYALHVFTPPPADAFSVSLPLDTTSDSLGSGAADLETTASEDDYTFTLVSPVAVEIDSSDCPAGYELHWELDDSTSSPIDSGGCGPHATSTLDAGTYTLRVTPGDGHAGTYALHVYPVPAPDVFSVSLPLHSATDSLGSGAANLETTASEDDYAFTLSGPEAIEIDASDCPNGSALHWELDDSTSSSVDSGGCGTHMTSALDAGAYTLRVVGQDGSIGTYTLDAYAVPAPDAFSVSLPLDTSTDSLGSGAANLETTASEDDYTFTLASAGPVVIDTGNCPGGYLLQYSLVDATGWQVAYGFCGTSGTPDSLDAGTYTLRVTPEGGHTGSYSLQVFGAPAPDAFSVSLPLDTATASLGGGAANLENLLSEDDYSFTLASAAAVEIDTSSCPAGFALAWTLIDSTGSDVTTGSCGDDTSPTLDPGSYTLEVTPEYGGTGTYHLVVALTTPDAFSVSLPLDTTTATLSPGEANLETSVAEDDYTFMLADAGAVELDTANCPGGYSPALDLVLVDSSDTTVATSDGCGRFTTPTLDAGTYTLEVTQPAHQPGTYDLDAFAVPAPDAFSVSLPLDTTTDSLGSGAANLETSVSEDDYTFTLGAEGAVVLDTGSCPGLYPPALDLVVKDSTDSAVASNDGCGHFVTPTLAAGSYTLEITQPDHLSGSYTLHAFLAPPADAFSVSLPLDTTTATLSSGEANLETSASEDDYTFSISQTRPVEIDTQECPGSYWPGLQLNLIDATSSSVASNQGCGDYTTPTLAPGTYTLQITEPEGDTGSYSLQIAGVAVAPINLTPPLISGTVTSGATLSVSNGTWSDSPSAYSYQWQRDGSDIPGATSSSYDVTQDDLGHAINAVVTASNSVASGDGEASNTLMPPANTTAPAISGTVAVGNTLTASPGTWDHSPTSYAYQWYSDGAPISGATDSTYTLSGDIGPTIDVLVTASNADGATVAGTISAPTITLDSSPSNPSALGSTSISWTSSGTYAVTECSVDGGAFEICTSPQVRTVGAGAHSLRTRVTNAAGTRETTARWTAVDGTVVDGTIASDTTWTTSGSPYIVANATLSSSATLTIDPGVVVKGFASASTLTVDGNLVAVGTSGSPISFTSAEDDSADSIDSTGDGATAPHSGDWGGVLLVGIGKTYDIEHTTIAYGGGNGSTDQDGTLDVTHGTATLSHDTLTESRVSGIVVDGGTDGTAATVEIDNTKLANNHFDGLTVTQAKVDISESVLIQNGQDGIDYAFTPDYAGTAGSANSNQIWANAAYGVQLQTGDGGFPDSSLPDDGGAPDGTLPNGSANNIYDNGLDAKVDGSQFNADDVRPDADWTNNFWGTGEAGSGAAGITCENTDPGYGYGLPGAVNPHHLWGGATNPYSGLASFQTLVGPVSSSERTWDSEGYSSGPESPYQYTHYVGYHGEPNDYTNGCQDDDVNDTPAASSIFNIPGVSEPPPVGGGIPDGRTWGGCLPCYLKSHPHHNLASVPNVRRGDPVDTATGALQEEFTDATMPGPGDPLVWMRAYTSDDPNIGILGKGWSTGYSDRLVIHDDGSVTYTTETGQQQVFTPDTNTGAYDPQTGVTSNLALDWATGDYTLVTQDNTSYAFDATGLLTSITPLNKPATSLSYTSGQLTSITDSAGRTTTLTYDELDPSLLSRVTLPDGRYVEYGYDNSELVSVRDLRGKTTTYTYDDAGRLATITDPDGHRTLDTHYDATSGRVDWQKDAYDHETTFAWDPASGTSTMTDPNGHTTTDVYYKNVLISTTDGRGKTTTYSYDANLNASTVTTATGQVTTTSPDQFGNLIERCVGATSPLCTTSTYNENGLLDSSTTARGKTTGYGYDDTNHLAWVVDPNGGATEYTYDSTTGEIATKTNADGKIWTYTYDAQGDLASVTSPLGFETTYGYDSTGRKTSMVEARGNVSGATAADYTWHYSYNDADQPLATTDPYGNATSTTYDDAGNELTATDARGKTTTYTYDDDNRLTSTTDPLSHTTTDSYDDAGNLASETDPAGNETTYTYNADNLVATKVMPRGNASGATASDYTYSYAYDDDDRIVSTTDPTGHTKLTSYDAYSRIHVETDELGHTTTYAYDADGDVTDKTDGVGNDQTYTYDDNDRLLSSTDERGKTTTYAYDPDGNLTSTTSPLGEINSLTYDDDGRLLSSIDPRGNAGGTAIPGDYTTTYGYNAAGDRSSMTDPLGHETTYTYDHDRRLATKTDASSNTWTYAYLADGSLATETNPLSGTTTYTYDDADNVSSVTDPIGNETTYTYTADDLVATKALPRGNATSATPADYTDTYTYDADGNETQTTDPTGHSEQTSYDKLDQPATTTDELGNVTTLTHDAAGNLTKSSDALGHHVDYTYDADNRMLTSADQRGKTTTYVYTAAGGLASSTTPLGEKTKYTYDDDERLATMIDPRGTATDATEADYTTTYGYDLSGNQTSVTDPLGDETTSTYDHAGQLASTTDANSHTTTYAYYPNGLLHTQTAPDTGITTYAYDGLSDQTSKTDTRGHTTASTYDEAGELLSTTDPVANETTYTYDPDGNVATETTPIGNASVTPANGRIAYTYDQLDELTGIAYGDGTHSVDYGYDAAGNRTSMTDSGGTVDYTYDNANRLTETTRGSQTFGYTLNADGQTTTLTQPDSSTVAYAYDDDRRMSTVTAASATTTYSYDPAGNVTGVAYPNGVTESDRYDDAGRLTNVTNIDGSSVLSEFAQTLDPAGNPTLVATTRGTNTTNEAFTYDANDRVLKDCAATSCTGAPDQIDYTYDKGGNQTSLARTISGTTTTTSSTYDNANELSSQTTGGTTTNYTYDANGGQLTAGSARTNTFNIAGELTSTNNGTATTNYTFDGDQNRLTATAGSNVTKFLWNTNTGDLPQLARTENGSGATIHTFTYGLTAIKSDAGYLQHDLIGSITDVTNTTGTPQWLLSYEPFGVTKAATSLVVGAIEEPLRFTGGYLDPESGNYYLNAREYDPNQSRFISRDPLTPLPGSSDYSYASNEPGVLVDPSGKVTVVPPTSNLRTDPLPPKAPTIMITKVKPRGRTLLPQFTEKKRPTIQVTLRPEPIKPGPIGGGFTICDPAFNALCKPITTLQTGSADEDGGTSSSDEPSSNATNGNPRGDSAPGENAKCPAPSEGNTSGDLTAGDLKDKTAAEIRQLAERLGLKPAGDPDGEGNYRKFKDPDTTRQIIRIDQGHVDKHTGKPFDLPTAAVPHVHGNDRNGVPIRDPHTNDRHFPLRR